MLLGKTDSRLLQGARASVTDAVTPLLDLFSRPVGGTVDAIEQAQNFFALAAENAELREVNSRLRHWQALAYRLEAENAALRDLLQMVPDPETRYLSARVVADTGGAFVRASLVNAGERDGIVLGQAAVTGEGLAGRVAQVGTRSARVLLITDINSRIPVMLADTRERAVLAGNNGPQPNLLYLGPRARVKVGDRLLTSGDGGVFPSGIPVGVIASLDDGVVQVQPYVDWQRMEFLRFIDLEKPGLLVSEEGG